MAYNLRKGPQRNVGQACFYAYLSGNASNVTGDGTNYTIVFNSVLYDQNNNFNTGTGVFTAPVTGRYLLISTTTFLGLTASHTGAVLRFNGSFAERGLDVKPYAISNAGTLTLTYSMVVSMSATNTLHCESSVSGGTKVVSIVAGNISSSFSGFLIC